MKRLDNRGTASWELTLVFLPLFTLVFVIFDLGRYAITMQSLRALANAGARAVMINCYTPLTTASTCNASSYLPSTAAEQAAAPFLFFGGLTPTLGVTAGANAWTVTAQQTGFTMLMPIWGAALNLPSASTSIPFD